MKQKGERKLTFEEKMKKCEEFIRTFEQYDLRDYGSLYEQYGRKKYMIEIQRVSNGESNVIQILLEDLQSFFRKDEEKQMVNEFRQNTMRNVKIFSEIVKKIMPERNSVTSPENELKQKFQGLLNMQRIQNLSHLQQNQVTDNQKIPNSIIYNFDLFIVYGPQSKIHIDPISNLDAAKIGSLVITKAIVIRTSDIRPQLQVATYACDTCGFQNYQQVHDRQYKPLLKCMSRVCVQNNVSGRLTFLPAHSSFKEFQQLKVQQTPDQLCTGKIPKTFTIHVQGENCNKAAPGDIVMIQGILIPVKKQDRKDSTALTFTNYIQAYKIIREKKKYVEMNLSEEQIAKIQSVRSNLSEEDLFQKMAKSIAPQIFGLQIVKKALLLLLVGGVTKITEDNLRIRGQINIALIGDPGIAKSQLLKHISKVAPRGVYTSGKGSSGVGLTAAVTIDPDTRQVFLEAGALVLADMGVCCIDQFDKMSEYDRTAIHEVMQQQTVSIAKAGITTSLNARASILAAANPLYGRYNKKQTAHKNINLPAALLSRFDLIFILLDQAEPLRDKQLAIHIGRVHQSMRAPQKQILFDSSFIRHYISISKSYEPMISEQLHKEMIQRYVQKRKQQTDISKEGENYTTMRSLLALIRLCQARAKLRFSNQVTRQDMLECMDIIDQSQKFGRQREDGKPNNLDISGSIFGIIRSVCLLNEQMCCDLVSLEKRVISKGYCLSDLQRAIMEYQKLNVLMAHEGYVRLII